METEKELLNLDGYETVFIEDRKITDTLAGAESATPVKDSAAANNENAGSEDAMCPLVGDANNVRDMTPAMNSEKFAGVGVEPDELDDLTSEKFSEVKPANRNADDEEEIDLPEDTVLPDKETQSLIADVIKVGKEFQPAHKKLNTIIKVQRAKIVFLKIKFGVRQGVAGYPLLITSNGRKTAMLWDEFVLFYFGVTSRRLNQLLDVKDDKDTRTTTKPSDEEKPLYKKGYNTAMEEAEKRLKLLQATPKAVDMAEHIVELEERLKVVNNQNWQLAETVAQYEDNAFRNPEEYAPAPEPVTMEAWEKHSLPDAKFQKKYFEHAKAYFVERYQYAFGGGDFGKVLAILKGDQKRVAANAQDIQQLGLVIADAAEHLKMLATVMTTMAKAPGQPSPEAVPENVAQAKKPEKAVAETAAPAKPSSVRHDEPSAA